jgi:formate dehydrogenase accessory protein FdhE
MNKNEKSSEDFILDYQDLKKSFQKLFEDRSFKKRKVKKNINVLDSGDYIVKDNVWSISKKENHDYIKSLLSLVMEQGGKYCESALKLSTQLQKSSSLSKRFVLNVLMNKEDKVMGLAKKADVGDDFISFISIFAAFPYRDSVSQFVQSLMNLDEKVSAYCPVCGHWPGISYIVGKEGKRKMVCMCCGFMWKFRRMKCFFCLSSEINSLGYLNVEGEESVMAYTCDNCQRYIKAIKVEEDKDVSTKEWAIVDYMNSGFIDIAARQNDYLQVPILWTSKP